MDVTRAELTALVAVHCGLLDGENPGLTLKAALGPLAVVPFDVHGWRRDGLARSHEFLSNLLVAYFGTSPRFDKHDYAEVHDVLRLHWGLAGAVHSRERAGAVIVPAIHRKVVGEWHGKTLTAAADLAATELERRLARDAVLHPGSDVTGVVIPSGDMPFWGGRESEWPLDPPLNRWTAILAKALGGWTTMDGDVLTGALRQLMIERIMNDVAGIGLGKDPRPQRVQASRPRPAAARDRNPDGALKEPDDTDWQARLDLLSEEFAVEELPNKRFRPALKIERHVIAVVLRPWAVQLRHGMSVPLPLMQPIDHARLPHHIAAARLTELAGWRVLRDRRLVERLNDVVLRGRTGTPLLSIPMTSGVAIDDRPPAARADRIAAATAQAVSKVLDGNGLMSADDALHVSRFILEDGVESSARELASRYLQQRRRIEAMGVLREPSTELGGDTAYARGIVALADLNVHLKMTDLKMHAQGAVLAKIIEDNGETYAYRDLALRNRALFRTKLNRFSEAAAVIDSAYARATSGLYREYREDLETTHQIALAATAIGASYVEVMFRSLTDDPWEREQIRTYLGASLRWAATTRAHLRDLQAYLIRMPEVRADDDRHIGWKDWYAATRQNRLRVLIAARTAVATGILTDPELAALEPSIDTTDRGMVSAYRAVLRTPESQRSGARNLGMQATWLGFLDRLRVPVEPDVDGMLYRVPFLEGSPYAHDSDDLTPHVELDIEASALWHREIKDPGNLGRIPRASAVWHALDARNPAPDDGNPGSFARWWTLLHAPRRTSPAPD